MLKEVSVEEVIPMRVKVLRPKGPVADCTFSGDRNPSSYHVGFYDSGSLAGIGSVIQESENGQLNQGVWRVRGMAVDDSYRRRGIGSKILQELISYVKNQNGMMLWCNARTSAIKLYQRHNFKIASKEFSLPVIGPHYRMKRNLG